MAIDRSCYPHKVDVGLWADNLFMVFLYRFNYDKKEYSGLIDFSSKRNWSKKDKISQAKSEMSSIKNKKKDSVQNEDIILDAFMIEYFSHLKQTKYVKIRRSHYERYIAPFCGKKKVVDIRQLHIRESIKFQEESGLAPRTVKQTLEVLAPAFKNAIANRLIAFNPLDGIKIKLPKTKKIVSSATQKLKEIHDAIYAVYGTDPFYLSLYLFALQGRRRGEILSLRWEDIVLEYNYYILRNTKNNEEQKIFLPQVIKEQLLQIPRVNGWVFASRISGEHLVDIRKATNKIKRYLNDESFGIHYLRNVMVSAMAEQGFDSIHLSGALGHNDPNTIKKYLTMNYLKSSEMASGVIDGIVGK
ncbi:MAG: site-specific integrase [Sulfurimonas sp.]|uniref:tyrosine-type recombinase/integrase n=1 Tax=Sulfurimonas sp. TaxID=2022749 RepID=UPI0028CFD5C5|nr:site-specific integrase [Sulfurimonas sp.]MDT8339317.1 site-specific integrase [Sulfurimonas sp.]